MRVGLNTGEVVVRAIGNDLHMDYSAVGRPRCSRRGWNRRPRPGAPGCPWPPCGWWRGWCRSPRWGRSGEGPGEPVEVFELVGASPLRRRLQAAAVRGLTPFVGRQPELEACTRLWHRRRPGMAVALVGEAGVGKSRLVYEVIHSHRTQGWRVLESASVSYGRPRLLPRHRPAPALLPCGRPR